MIKNYLRIYPSWGTKESSRENKNLKSDAVVGKITLNADRQKNV